jgi:hypothetical protein
LAGAEQLQYLHQRDLHGIGIFEQAHGENVRPLHSVARGIAIPGVPHAIVKIAAPLAAQRGRPALRPIHFDMLTSWNIFETHNFSLSSFFGFFGFDAP